MFLLLYYYVCAAAYYRLFNDQSKHQIPFNAPPATITTNITTYINFRDVDNFLSFYNSTLFARLSVVSSYSGIDLPVNNTIVPVVTLTAPNGTESMIVDILLNINESHIERCHDSFLNQSFNRITLSVNIHSPLMYTQLGEHNFTIALDLIDYRNKQEYANFHLDDYILTVNVTSNG